MSRSTKRRFGISKAAASVVLAALTLPAIAEQGGIVWKRFHAYPAGQYRNVATTYRDGKPGAAPLTTTVCANALTPQQASTMMDLAHASTSTCTRRLLSDQPALAAYEQTCPRGGTAQVIRTTLRAIDDHRLDVEMRSRLGGHETLTQITSTYLGPCSTSTAPPASVAKPSADECRQISDMRRQAAGNPCAAFPAAARNQCVAQMEAGRRMYDRLAQACR